jgi:hypothetical protein
MWTIENRPRYDRDKLRYPSDLTDEEWAHIEPLIPPAKHGGRRREVNVREVVNAIMYLLSTVCQWRYIPKDLPPRSTVHDYFVRWDDEASHLTALEATTTVLEGIALSKQDGSHGQESSRATDTAIDAFADTDDDMKPARGILNGILFAVPVWGRSAC